MSEAQAAPALEYAGWWSRAGALLIDGLILSVPSVVGIVILVAAGAAGDDDGNSAVALVGLLFIFCAIVLPFVYFPYLHSREHGQTWGKRATGLRVRTSDGSRLTGGRSFARYAIQVVFGIFYVPLLLDYLWPLWDARNQSLHDKVVDSVVVRA